MTRPRSHTLSDTLGAWLLFLIVLSAITATVRYLDGREQVVAALETRYEKNRALLAEGKAEDLVEKTGADAGVVVRGGEVDRFNIVRGRRVSLRFGTDESLQASAALKKSEIMARAGWLEAQIDAKAPLSRGALARVAELDERRAYIVDVPLWKKDGQDKRVSAGMVRAVYWAPPIEPVIPTAWFFWGLLLAAALFGGCVRIRPPHTEKVLGILAALVAAGVSIKTLETNPATCFATAILTGLIVGAGAGGMADVLRGIRHQPRTYALLAPAFLAMVLVVFLPFIMGVMIAFVDHEGLFVGLANFEEILSPAPTEHPNVYWTFGVTTLWTALNVFLHVSIGIMLAMVLNRPDLRFKGLYRVLLIVPWAVPSYVTALVWKGMFNTNEGAINALMTLLGMDGIDWLGQSFTTNFIANLTTNTWLGFPFMMVVTLGALQSIPQDLYEAADIDGASRWQRFRFVTAPLLKPALIPAIILGTIWTFNMFNVIYLVSNGAPDNETNILITEAYRAFRADRLGYAAAYSIIIFVILLVYGWMTNRLTKATEGAYE